jgi:hypothetical protein
MIARAKAKAFENKLRYWTKARFYAMLEFKNLSINHSSFMGKFDSQPAQEPKFEVIRNIAEDPLAEEPQGNFEEEESLQLDTSIDFANIKNSKEVGSKVATYVERMLEDDDVLGTLAMKPAERANAVKQVSGNPELISEADALMAEVKAGRKSEAPAMAELGAKFAKIRDKAKEKLIRNKLGGKS